MAARQCNPKMQVGFKRKVAKHNMRKCSLRICFESTVNKMLMSKVVPVNETGLLLT